MNEDYELLIEKEAMWAQLYIQVLEENDISYMTVPVYGAGLTMNVGGQEVLRIYVPKSVKEKAEKLLQEYFTKEHSSK